MAIEPISSLMTVQAQGSAVTQKPQTPVETERPDSSTSSAPAAELVDRRMRRKKEMRTVMIRARISSNCPTNKFVRQWSG